MPNIQHYITGASTGGVSKIFPGETLFDTSIEGIAHLYGVSNNAVSDATFGGHSKKAIYDWLSQNGGLRQTPYSEHSSGYHWSFKPGMVANVPLASSTKGITESLSPVPNRDEAIGRGDPVPEPAGPIVDVGSVPIGEGMNIPEVAESGMGNIFLILAGAIIIWMIFRGKTGKTTRKVAKKTTRKRRRY